LGSWIWGHVAERAGIKTGLIAAAVGLVLSLVLYRRGTRLASHMSENTVNA